MFDDFKVDLGWLWDQAVRGVVWGLGLLSVAFLLFGGGCSGAQPSDDDLRIVKKGHFEFKGSQCQVYETVTTGSAVYSVLQRFSVCDPPILGMLPGSKPAAVPGKETNAP